MKYAPTISRHQTIDPERTKRHMLRSTPDRLTLRLPTTNAEGDIFQAKFEAWIKAWGELHHETNPLVITSRDPNQRFQYFTARKG